MIERITSIIRDIANQGSVTLEVCHTTRLREDFGLDSLQLAQLTVEVEDEFDVDIFEDGMVETIGDLIAKIEGK